MARCNDEIWSPQCWFHLLCQRRLGHDGDHQALDPRHSIAVDGQCLLPPTELRQRFYWGSADHVARTTGKS